MAVYRPKYRDPKTGALVESEIWWYEFTFTGKRIRQSAKTARKTIAIQAEKQKRMGLERALAGMPTENRKNRVRTVSEVLAEYAKGYPVNHRAKSALRVRAASARLKRVLGSALQPDLTQAALLITWPPGGKRTQATGPSTSNWAFSRER